jgi:uncharacterized membrane protein YgcG
LRNAVDLSSWQAILTTLLSLAVITLVMVGIRLVVMQTVQQRRERENRQINERLRTLIAAYKTLGGSFTGDLAVDPTHLRDLRQDDPPRSDRRRRVRDAVEAALSDVILLGTEEQVRLAAGAANDLAAGRPVETAALVVSLRAFIREVLDLEPIAGDLEIPKQGPLRPSTAGGRGTGRGDAGGTRTGEGGEGRGRGGGRAGGGGAGGAGVVGAGLGASLAPDGEAERR